jgi:transcriptional regulator with XRE-family HTH domain
VRNGTGEERIVEGEVQRRTGRRLRDRREELGWARDQLARRAQVSLSLVAQFERGEANPSLGTLAKLAAAAGLTLAELVADIDEASGSISRPEPTVMWRGRDGSQASLVVAASGKNETELWRYRIAPGDGYDGEPHPAGSEVLIHVLTGELDLTVADRRLSAVTASSLRFRSDVRHRYANATSEPLSFVLVYSRSP